MRHSMPMRAMTPIYIIQRRLSPDIRGLGASLFSCNSTVGVGNIKYYVPSTVIHCGSVTEAPSLLPPLLHHFAQLSRTGRTLRAMTADLEHGKGG